MIPEIRQISQSLGHGLLIHRANGQDYSIRYLGATVIMTRCQLSDGCGAKIYEVFLREKGFAPGVPRNMPLLSACSVLAPDATAIRSVSLEHIENVNALALGREIEALAQVSAEKEAGVAEPRRKIEALRQELVRPQSKWLGLEKNLLKGVTERYRPNVRMTMLRQIRTDHLPGSIQEIVPIFEKCCRIIASYSQPLVIRGVNAILQDLKDEWRILQGARREYLQK